MLRQHVFELPSQIPHGTPSPPRPLPRVALPRRLPPPPTPTSSSPNPSSPPKPPTSPSTWLYLTATLSRECITAEEDLAYILRSHTGWTDLLEGLQQSERQCLADRQQLAKEVAGLRALMAAPREGGGGGGGASREEVLAALKEYRERQRHSYAALCGEERTLLNALSSSSKLLSIPLPPSTTLHTTAPRGAMVEEKEREEGEGEEGGGREEGVPKPTTPLTQKHPQEGGGGDMDSPTGSPQPPLTLQQRYDAVRARVAALDAEEASVGPGVLGWDPLDKKKGGAEDAARFTSALNQFLATSSSSSSIATTSGGGGGEEGGVQQQQLTPGEEEAFLARVGTLIPGREEGALRKFLAGALRAKARRREKMAALGEWKALRVALQRAAAAGYSGGGGGDTSFSSSSSSSFNGGAAAGGNGNGNGNGSTWVGPDALARIAVVEWRASKEAEKALAAAEAEAVAAAASMRAKVERDAWIQTQRNTLSAWQEGGGGGGGGGGKGGGASTKHPPLPPPPAPLDPMKALAVQARSAAAEQAAAARRKAVEGKKAAVEAAVAARRGDGRVAEAMERVAKGGVGLRSAALFFGASPTTAPTPTSPLSPGESPHPHPPATNTSSSFIPPPLPERPTNASISHALSKRELREREVVRAGASAHERALPSVKPLARGKTFGIGAFGALPSRAMPAWRKKL